MEKESTDIWARTAPNPMMDCKIEFLCTKNDLLKVAEKFEKALNKMKGKDNIILSDVTFNARELARTRSQIIIHRRQS